MTSENIQVLRIKEQITDQPKEPCLSLPQEQPSGKSSKRKFKFIWTPSDTEILKESLPLLLFGMLVLFSTATLIALLIDKTKSNDDLYDYLAYVFPSLAAVAAGLNIVIRKERLWFWISSAFVFSGFLLYAVKNGLMRQGIYQTVYLLALVAIIVMILVVSKLQDNKWSQKRWVSPVFGWAAIILIPLQICLIMSIDRKPSQPASIQRPLIDMRCQKISDDLANGLVLRCSKTS
jgi:hypothetical protein